MLTKKSIAALIKVATVGVAISVLTACGAPAPKTEIAYAEATLQAAQNADLAQHSGVELERSSNKLQQAKAKMKAGENIEALRLANEALAVANFAQAKSQAGVAKTTESDMQKSLDVLKNQLK